MKALLLTVFGCLIVSNLILYLSYRSLKRQQEGKQLASRVNADSDALLVDNGVLLLLVQGGNSEGIAVLQQSVDVRIITIWNSMSDLSASRRDSALSTLKLIRDQRRDLLRKGYKFSVVNLEGTDNLKNHEEAEAILNNLDEGNSPA
jgi:hypothetical protein